MAGVFHKIKNYSAYILYFILALLFVRLVDFNGFYGQDSYEYAAYTNQLIHFFKTGAHPADYFWPLCYPHLGALLSVVFKTTFALQLISLVSLVLSAIYLEKILLLLFSECIAYARVYVCLFFMLSPYVLRAAMVVMPDSLCVLCITAFFYYFVSFKNTSSVRAFVLLLFFALAAVTTRYAAVAVLIFPLLLIVWQLLKEFNWKLLLTSIFILVLFIIPHFTIAHPKSTGLGQHDLLTLWLHCSANFFSQYLYYTRRPRCLFILEHLLYFF